MNKLKITPISLVVLLMMGNVSAQIAPPPNYDQKLKDVIVDATRSGTPLDEIPLNTTILTPEVLEISPDQTIDQILKNVPGVILSDTPYYAKDPTGQSINVRGLGNARTLVLIDGAPALDPFYGTVQWNQVPMSSIESVEFVRGGVSSLWGNYGMGGVINIKTKNVTNSQQDASVSYGSFGTGNVAASKDVIASDTLQMRFSADYFGTEGYQTAGTISPATVMPNQNASLKNGQGPSWAQNTNFRVQGYFKPSSDTNGFFRMGYHTMADLSSGYASVGANNLIQQTDVSTGLTTRLDEASRIETTAFYQNGIFNKQNGSNVGGSTGPTTAPYVSGIYQDPSSTVGASVQYVKDLKGIIDQYVVGVDARNISAANMGNNLSSTTIGQTTSYNYAKGQQNFYGLLGQLKSKSSDIPLQTTLAARLDMWNSQTPVNYNTGVNGANPVYTAVPNQQKTQLSPTLGFLYNASSNLDLRASAYQAFHAPGMNNTLRTYGSSSGWYFANPILTPETMTGYEMGADYRWKAGFIQVTGFNNFIKNAIVNSTLSSSSASDVALSKQLCGGTYTGSNSPLTVDSTLYGGICNSTSMKYYTNKQNQQNQGLEFQYHQDLNQNWALDAGYAYTIARLTWSGTSDPTGYQLGGVPKNIGSAGVTWYPVPKASLTTNVRYVGNSFENVGNKYPLPAYAIVGLRGNYELTPQTSIFTTVTNLFNRQYLTINSTTSVNAYVQGMPQAITIGARVIF